MSDKDRLIDRLAKVTGKNRREVIQAMEMMTARAMGNGAGGFGGIMVDMGEIVFQDRTKNVELERSHETQKVTIPDTMPTAEAIKWLQRKVEEEESEFDVSETLDAFLFDAMYSLKCVIQEKYDISLTDGREIQTMFGPLKVDCLMMSVEISPGVFDRLPFGNILLPGIDAKLSTGFQIKNERMVLQISGKVKGMHRKSLFEFLDEVRAHIQTHSIYRGQAVRLNFRDSDGDKLDPSPDLRPEFFPIDSDEVVIFNEAVRKQMDATMFNCIQHTDRMRERSIPIGRKILLEGDYGTGKTLTAKITAARCVENGWTFIYVTDPRDLNEGLRFAEQYSPACVFIEDVDHLANIEDEDDLKHEIQSISTCLDGVDNKHREVMVVMTTNKVTEIPKILLRPGRTDTVIHIGRPDEETMLRLVRHYAGQRLQADDDAIRQALSKVIGQSASFFAEMVKRARMISITNPDDVITADDLQMSAEQMLHHAAILDGSYCEMDGALDDSYEEEYEAAIN